MLNPRKNPFLAHQVALVVLLLASVSRGGAEEASSVPLDSIEQRAQPCMACHGKEGRATPEGYYPRIAGKPSGYLFNQLVNFRVGRRHFPVMNYMVDRQNDAFLQELADYFGSLHLPYAIRDTSGAAPALLERGRVLVTEGDETLRVPSCQSCHAKSLLGTMPAVPGLLGLSPDYVIGQLGAWRNGTRRAHEPDCMGDIAKKLQPSDIAAVAWWLAGQPVPADATAATDFETPPTVTCGSFPDANASTARSSRPVPSKATALSRPAIEGSVQATAPNAIALVVSAPPGSARAVHLPGSSRPAIEGFLHSSARNAAR